MSIGRVNPNKRLEDQGITGLGEVHYNLIEPALIEAALRIADFADGSGGGKLVEHGAEVGLELALVEAGLTEPHVHVAVAVGAYRLYARGFEGRHIRSLRLAADREVDLLAQLVSPLLRHRNPKNRRRAAEVLADGANAGAQLQESLVRSRLRKLLEA